MNIAITGGTGFVGRNIARALVQEGHTVVLLARGVDKTDPTILKLPGVGFIATDLTKKEGLTQALRGCEAVVHCAGINRERGQQTFHKVHVEGTLRVVEAAQCLAVRKVVLISFLRARPSCGSPYHESKWEAEEIVHRSGLDFAVLKCGVIYGKGDHLLDHLSHAVHTFPLFALVGSKDKPIRPNAVEDIARIAVASVLNGALSRKTVAVLGPDEMTLRDVVGRVAHVIDRHPLTFPLPAWVHYGLGWFLEMTMTVPLISTAQVRMLSEGLAEPASPCDPMPDDLAPRIRFTADQIRKGLPAPGPFTWRDIRCCSPRPGCSRARRSKRVFFEMP